MTYWTDPIAIGFVYASFIVGLAMVSRAVWRALWRRDDRRRQQAQCLAAGIADERRFAAFVEDMFGDEPTVEILAVDPPVVPAYIPPAGMVWYRGGAVHPDCAQRWLRFDMAPVDGCAVWLTDSLKASTP